LAVGLTRNRVSSCADPALSDDSYAGIGASHASAATGSDSSGAARCL